MYFAHIVNAHLFQGPFKHPVFYDPAAGAFFIKNTPLEFWSMYLVDFVNMWQLGGHQGWGDPGPA